MEESSYNYKDFFEISPDLLIISTFDGNFKKINHSVVKALGYSKEELLNQPINDFIHPEDKEGSTATRKILIKNGSIINFENRLLTKSGEIVWLEWSAKSSEKDGVIYSVAKEITYKKVLEIDRDLLISDLQQENQSYKKLTYTTAHDLRSPVDSLLSIFNLLDMSSIKDDNNRTLMEVLKRGSEQLRTKLNDYIDNLGKNQKVKVALEEVSIQKTFDEVTYDIKNLIKTSNAKIETNFSEVDTVPFNKDYLHSIFLNLISNSIKYSKPNSSPELFIKSTLEDEKVILTFTDKGLGIDKEKSKGKIFGLHQTFHGNQKDSKGIGLYLVHTHITSFGGTIDLESEPGKGTTFILTFNKLFA